MSQTSAARAARRLIACVAFLSALPAPATAQASRANVQQSGPLIFHGGTSAAVPDATFKIPEGHDFRVMFEINLGNDSTVSQQVGTVARFYNLHGRHGIPRERLHAAAVFHGTGWYALLTDSAHTARFGRPNPSRALVEELLAAGARFAMCGQTAAFRGVRREELLPGVDLAISAMTALNVFYAEGYRLNPWR